MSTGAGRAERYAECDSMRKRLPPRAFAATLAFSDKPVPSVPTCASLPPTIRFHGSLPTPRLGGGRRPKLLGPIRITASSHFFSPRPPVNPANRTCLPVSCGPGHKLRSRPPRAGEDGGRGCNRAETSAMCTHPLFDISPC